MRKILLLILTFTIGISQIQYGGEPKYKLDWKDINFLNTYNLKKINNNLHPMVLKYGDEYGLDINILNQSTKIISKNETTFYLGFESKNAKAISLVFDEFKLSQNSKMFIYNHDHSMFIGSFNSKNNSPTGDLATALVKGDKTIIELTIPNNEIINVKLQLKSIIHDFYDLMNFHQNDSSSREDCNDNVACSSGNDWEDQIDSVVLVTSNGGSCSGAIVNNTNFDLTPYLLYAAHCNGGGSSTVYFDYQSNTCNGNNSGSYNSMSGTQNLAIGNFNNNDYALIRLNNNIPNNYNVYYAGWNKSTQSPGNNVVGIHHPDGGIKKISYDAYGMYSSGNEWVFAYDEGRVIPGSSGSPFFDSSKRVRGMASYIMTNYCSPSPDCYCSQSYYHGYAKFSSAWNYIDDYLDPNNTGESYIDGTRDGSGGEPELTIISPNGGESILAGTNFQIQWVDDISENVSLKLYKEGYFIEDITTSTSSDGSFNWSSSALLEESNQYKIKITSISDNTVYDYSDSYFTITEPLGELEVYFGEISSDYIDIMLNNPDNVSGYQFNILDLPDYINITGAYGGSTENQDFLISTSENGTVIAFSLTGQVISPNNSLLTKLEYSLTENCNNCDQTYICIEEPIFSNQEGLPYPVNTGSCQNINLNSYQSGDVNFDDIINILDIVLLVGEVLNPGDFTDSQFNLGDLNSDELLNILDVVLLVNLILN